MIEGIWFALTVLMYILKDFFSILMVFSLGVVQPIYAANTETAPRSLYETAKLRKVKIKAELERHELTKETYGTSIKILMGTNNPIRIKLARASIEHINGFSPSALYKAQTFKQAGQRLPMETMIFYSMMFMSSWSQGLFSGDVNDPAPIDTFRDTVTDPIGYLGFGSFVMMSTATQKAGGAAVSMFNSLSKEYFNELKQDVKNIEHRTKSKTYSSSAKNISNPPIKFRASNVMARALMTALGPLGMSFGMFASQNVEQLFHDEDIAICAASWKSYIIGKAQDDKFVGHCDRAYKKWFTAEKLERLWPSMVGMLASMTISHMITGGAEYLIKAATPKNSITEFVFKGLSAERGKSLQLLEKIPGLKFFAPFRFTFGSLAFQGASLWLFMSIEEAYMSEYFTIPVTDWVTKGQIKEGAVEIENRLKELRLGGWKDGKDDYQYRCTAKGTNYETCFKQKGGESLSDQLRGFSETLFSYRQNKLTKAMMANQGWLKFMQEYVATYQGAYRVYDKFVFELENSKAPNAFLVMDYLRGVKIDVPGIGRLAVRSMKEPVSESMTYDEYLIETRGDLTGNGREAHLRSERFRTIVRAQSLIEGWLKTQASGSLDNKRLQKIIDQFEFADTSKDIQELLKKQLAKNTESKKKSEYQNAIDEGNSPENNLVWEYNRRGYEVAKGIREIETALLEIVKKDKIQSLEQIPANHVFRILIEIVGALDVPSQPGEQVLSELTSDPESIDPESESLHPKSIDVASTPAMIDYLVTSMACGPEVVYTAPLNLNGKMSIEEMGEVVEKSTGLVRKPWLDKIYFMPPRIVDLKGGKTVCHQRYTSAQVVNPLTDVIVATDELGKTKNYLGIMSYVRANIDPKLLGKTEGERNFFLWWNKHLGSVTKEIFTYLRSRFQNILEEKFFPVISNDLVVENGLGGMPLAQGVAESILQETDIYLALMYLNYQDSVKFEGLRDFQQALGTLRDQELLEKDWENSDQDAKLSADELKQVKAFFAEVRAKFSVSRDLVRQFGGNDSLDQLQKGLEEFKKNQKELEELLNQFGVMAFGKNFDYKTVRLPLTPVGQPKHYLELGIRTLLDLHQELNSYGRMAALMAINFYEKK